MLFFTIKNFCEDKIQDENFLKAKKRKQTKKQIIWFHYNHKFFMCFQPKTFSSFLFQILSPFYVDSEEVLFLTGENKIGFKEEGKTKTFQLK